MDKTLIVAVVGLAYFGLSALHGEKLGQTEDLKRTPTHAELAKRMATRTNPLAANRGVKILERAAIETKEKRREYGGLLERSTLISHGGFWTMVPKGSILHVPPAYKNRLSDKPTGQLLPWKEFYQRNRGWIFTQTVDMANARGESTLPQNVLKNHQQLGRVVVAVLHQGPISVKAPKPAGDQPNRATSPPLTP